VVGQVGNEERRSLRTPAILQIVPRLPGSLDGVGDYASLLAEQLRRSFGIDTKFVAPPFSLARPNEFAECSDIVLHYVNYGYQSRGVPRHLPSILRELKQSVSGKFITIFHELYATAPPWRSAFWLRRLQKSIARTVAELSDASVVSSETMRELLREISPAAAVEIHPVVSTLGEPDLVSDQFVRRDPHRWVIFGGTHLVESSLGSFLRVYRSIPEAFAPRELFVIGGEENEAVRRDLGQLRNVESQYRPALKAEGASEVLLSCSFGWLDYFRQRGVPTDTILKSASFASYCGHGVIPIFPHEGSPIALRGDRMPGPYFVAADRSNLPTVGERAEVAAGIYDWYRRHASVEHLARAIAELLGMKQ
jgi:hypothetical protein